MTQRERRSDLLESVRLDLLGPVEENERLFDFRVRDRYLLGMLATDGTAATDPSRGDDVDGPDVDGKDAGPAAVEAAAVEDRSSAQPMLFPSSMGLSFAVKPEVAELSVEVTWGEYARADNPVPFGDRPEWQQRPGSSDKFNRCWERTPRRETRSVTLQQGPVSGTPLHGPHGTVAVEGTASRSKAGFWLVTLFVHNRQSTPQSNEDEAWLFQPVLTVSAPDGAAVFAGRAEAIGVQKPDPTIDGDADERARLDMQFRRRVEFARGHAVSAHTEAVEGDPNRTDRVSTTFLPTYEVARTAAAAADTTPELDGLVTDMTRLATLDAEALRGALLPLADGYASWLEAQAAAVPSNPTLAEHTQAAEDALYDAELVADAIREGIGLLSDGSDALAAFRFANLAMAEQRLRSDAVAARRKDGADSKDSDLEAVLDKMRADASAAGGENRHTRWRPFQLAFVLLNLAALADPTHKSRSDEMAPVDLLFFPTGGGKTEAYLGLVAITLATRRLSADLGGLDGSDGVAVLMRYTLRLLTAQQFERAAVLMCAAEALRRDDPAIWGTTPFRLGMWVGGSLTPNRTGSGYGKSAGDRSRTRTGAADAVNRLRDGKTVYGGSPHQLFACPWCGTDIDPTAEAVHVFAADDEGTLAADLNPQQRTVTYCPDDDCIFGSLDDDAKGEGIPVVTVDDEVYRLLPAFVIGTIDKFAQMTWNPNVRMLFGRVHDRCPTHGWRGTDISYRPRECNADVRPHGQPVVPAAQACHGELGRLRPPDLIIQDEFHLITGPLGTMAGLYETAVDELCSWDLGECRIRPKVVASTATIRRAADQTRAVFARTTRVFPPQVLDTADTFFARDVPVGGDDGESSGRLYVGVCASGRRMKEAEARLFRTAMAAAQHVWDEAEPHVMPGKRNPADPWMTTVGYFSSIRELAGMYRIATDELPKRLQKVESDRTGFLGRRTLKQFTAPDGQELWKSWDLNVVELTSRVGAADLRGVLDRLFDTHDYRLVEFDRAKSGWALRTRGIDLVLATNMISVGVDVSRLGMMVVVGQPKTTAEYIQASSRVGRDYDDAPGVVFNLASWSRPRDLSHWEQFEHYHATFYRNVEAQSVTPFAPRALDRAATGVFVSLLRGLRDDVAPDGGVTAIAPGDKTVDHIVELFASRAAFATGGNATHEVAAREAAKDRGGKLAAKMTDRTVEYRWRKYRVSADAKGPKARDVTEVMHSAEDVNGVQPWVAPNSLRNTEPGINLEIDRDRITAGQVQRDPQWRFPTWDDDGTAPVRAGADAADDVDADAEADQVDALVGADDEVPSDD
jgi:hypothetical protein